MAVSKQTVHRPRLSLIDRVFWSWLSWPSAGWQGALAFVQPRAVIAWQKLRWRDHWRRVSPQGSPGRPTIAPEVRDLIRTMSRANPLWGPPRLVGARHTLGIAVAKSTVETHPVQPRKPPSPTWKTFLQRHVQDLGSLDCLVVPTLTHQVLFVLLILAQEQRRVAPCNVTEHPTAQWTAQHVVDAFPWDEGPRDLLHDRDQLYGAAYGDRGRDHGATVAWQNPYVKRLIGSL